MTAGGAVKASRPKEDIAPPGALRRQREEDAVLQAVEHGQSVPADLVWHKLGVRLNAVNAESVARHNTHLHGGLVPMPCLREIADRQGVKIVEDACQCPGALIDGRRSP